MEQVKQFGTTMVELPRRVQVIIAGVALVTLFVLYFVISSATATGWVTFSSRGNVSNLSEKLNNAGIDNKIENGKLMVPATQKVDASKLLGDTGHATVDTIFGSTANKYGMTQFEQKLRSKQADEGKAAQELQDTLGVDGVEVNLNIPDESLFADAQSDAGVTITAQTGGQGLDPKQVQQISSYATKAFKDMKPENIGIFDDTGNSFTGDDANGGSTMDANEFKLRLQDAYNNKVESDLQNKIDAIAGPGKAILSSNADLDMDAVERKLKHFGDETGKQGPAESEKVSSEVLAGGSTLPNGATGVTSNIPDTANPTYKGADTLVTGDSSYAKSDAETVFSNDELTEARRVAPGAVLADRLSIVMDSSVPTKTQNAVKEFVTTQMHGTKDDAFSISEAKLSKTADPAAVAASQAHQAMLLKYLKWALAGFGLLGAAFFLRRALNARTVELMTPSEDIKLLEASFDPVPLKQLEAAVNAASSLESQKRQELQRRIENLTDHKPSDVALMLRGWIQDAERRGA